MCTIMGHTPPSRLSLLHGCMSAYPTARAVSAASLLVCGLIIYAYVQRLPEHSHATTSSLDKYVPFVPVMIIPYFAFFCGIPALAAVLSPREYTVVVCSSVLCFFVAIALYVAFPTRVDRPIVVITSPMISEAFAWLYNVDLDNNACPSLHIVLCWTTAVGVQRTKKCLSLLSCAAFVTVVVSVMCTKQHSILDVVCGLILAILSIAIVDKYLLPTKSIQKPA